MEKKNFFNDEELFEKILKYESEVIEQDDMIYKPQNNKGRKTDNSIIQYTLNDSDKELVLITKNLINESNITNQDIYNVYGRDDGWNMIYGLRNNSITWDRFKKWIIVLGYSDVTLELIKNDKVTKKINLSE